MSSNGNGKRSDFYKKRAIEIADFLFNTKTVSDNSSSSAPTAFSLH